MKRAVLLLLFGIAACNDAPAPPNHDTTSGEGGSSGATLTGSDATMGADSTGSTTGQPGEVVLDVWLELEALEDVRVEITSAGDEHTAAVTMTRGFGVAPVDEAIVGPARIDALPEIGATIYGARLSVPAIADGPCGDEPLSLALALHRDQDSTFVAGGLTPYCGADRWYGVPPIEPLRISGHLPR
jgi:hypothetical protein